MTVPQIKSLLEQIRLHPPASLLLYQLVAGQQKAGEDRKQKEMDAALAKMGDAVKIAGEKPKTQRRLRGIVEKRTGRIIYDAGMNIPAKG